jgi:hypothetical protein
MLVVANALQGITPTNALPLTSSSPRGYGVNLQAVQRANLLKWWHIILKWWQAFFHGHVPARAPEELLRRLRHGLRCKHRRPASAGAGNARANRQQPTPNSQRTPAVKDCRGKINEASKVANCRRIFLLKIWGHHAMFFEIRHL